MKNRRLQFSLAALILATMLPAPVMAQQPGGFASAPARRASSSATFIARDQSEKAQAEAIARANGWRIRGIAPAQPPAGAGAAPGAPREYELIAIGPDGRPVYVATDNVNAAITTAANEIRETAPHNLTGAGVVIGLWDGGAALAAHQEFAGRVLNLDASAHSDHATHVAGTLCARGFDSDALGMSPGAQVDSYWNALDLGYMTLRAAASPGEEGKIYLSNHSYGTITGWDFGDYSGTAAWHWFGTRGDPEDLDFGRYDARAADWDEICFEAPYYLPFKSAGNDRGDGPPSNGSTFYTLDAFPSGWTPLVYSNLTGPAQDGAATGYDTIPTYGNAKNIMTVGAINDAVAGGVRSLGAGSISSFSGWGPTDDGRIKPDVVGNGVGLYSSVGPGVADYDIYSGTSMSTPNTCGTAALLIEQYARLLEDAMRSSTLKGLILHTADDLGNPGPDYTYGWGLMNARTAADLIAAHAADPQAGHIIEAVLDEAEPVKSFLIQSDGVTPLRVTLCWTDPPAAGIAGLDNPAPALVNDLDLRVAGPGDAAPFTPFILDPANPSIPATYGDNTRDNVEQIDLPGPNLAGFHNIDVSRKGTLSGGHQAFSLIVSGQTNDSLALNPATKLKASGPPGGPFAPSCKPYTLQNLGATAVDWTAVTSAAWLVVEPTSGTLGSGESVGLDLCLDPGQATLLAAGHYEASLTVTNGATAAEHIRGAELDITGCIDTLPFTEDFEAGTVPRFYAATSGTGTWRTVVSGTFGGYAGSAYALIMDDSTDNGAFSRNEYTLCYNLAGQSGLELSFVVVTFGDPHPPPATPFVDGADFDGVAISPDGINWYPIVDLSADTADWIPHTVDLDAALATWGIGYTDGFRIRFVQYDNRPLPYETMVLDDIRIGFAPTPTPTPTPIVTDSPTPTPIGTESPRPTPTETESPTPSPTATSPETPTPTPVSRRAFGDFNNSGCTDIEDFLFLLDNWQIAVEGIPIGLDDFLALLDNWQTGPGC